MPTDVSESHPHLRSRRRHGRAAHVLVGAVALVALVAGCAKPDSVDVGAGGAGTSPGTAPAGANLERAGTTAHTTTTDLGASSEAEAPDSAAACAIEPAPPIPGADPAAPTVPGQPPITTIPVTTVFVCNDTPGVPGPDPHPGDVPTTCVDVPATTTPFDPGGGRLACSSPGAPGSGSGSGSSGVVDPSDPDGSVSSPPMTVVPDAPIPGMPPPLAPDATHGVLRGTTGGGSCPVSAEVCDAMYNLQPATISVLPAGGGAPVTTVQSDGGFSVLLAPGTYLLKTTPTSGPRTCADQTVTITANATTDTSIDCVLPG